MTGEVDPEARVVIADVLHEARGGDEHCPDGGPDGGVWCSDTASEVLAALAAKGFSVGRWEHVANRHAYQRPDGATYYVLTAPDELPFTKPAWTEPLYRRVKGESE